MRHLWGFVLFVVILSYSSFGYDWSSNPGDGSSGNPYRISTPEQLMSIGSDPNLRDKHFILTDNINLNPALPGNQVFNTAVIAPAGAGALFGTAFKGTFNGNEHIITGLTIDATTSGNDYLGLFGSLDHAKVANVTMEGVSITGGQTSQYLGALCGYTFSSDIENCSVSGTIETEDSFAGGLTAYEFFGNIIHCSSSCSVTASTSAGGLVGYQDCGLIRDSFATGDVTASDLNSESIGGGLAGEINLGKIQNSFASGNVSVSACYFSCAGGLVGYQTYGWISNCFVIGQTDALSLQAIVTAGGVVGKQNYGQITNSYAMGAVYASSLDSAFCASRAGGLVGYQSGSSYSMIDNCYAWGMVDASCASSSSYSATLTTAGGLVGYQTGSAAYIENSYSIGKVTGDYNLGGFLGLLSSGTVTNCFWDTQTSETAVSAGGTGKTTTEMQTLSTFIDAEWDFTNETTNGVNNFWRIFTDGAGYPQHSWELAQNGDFAYPDGVGIEDLLALAETWLFSETDNPTTFGYACDADGNKKIDMGDFAVLSRYWLEN